MNDGTNKQPTSFIKGDASRVSDVTYENIPEGWITVALEELGEWGSGGTPKRTVGRYFGGRIPWLKIGDLNDGLVTNSETTITEEGLKNSAAQLLPPNTLLVAMYGSIGKLGITSIECATNQAIAHCLPFTRLVDLKFLFWVLLSHRQDLVKVGKGGAQQNISQTILKAFRIKLPPLAEQQRIIAKVDQLVEQVEEVKSRLERTKLVIERFRQAILDAACSGRLTEEWRAEHPNVESAEVLLEQVLNERRKRWEVKYIASFEEREKKPRQDWRLLYKPPKPVDASELKDIPQSWIWTNLDQLKEYSFYGPRFSSDQYASEGYLVLRTSDIVDSGKVNLATPPRIQLSDDELSKYHVEKGDILITRTGSIGTVAVFNDDVDAIPGAYLIQYRLATEIATAWYVFYFLKSPAGQTAMMGGTSGSGRPNLNAPTIDAIPIPLPPMDEQNEILKRIRQLLSFADSLEEKINASLERAEKMSQSILAKAFRGELIPTEAELAQREGRDYEHASALLKRIKAERAVLDSGQRQRKGKVTKKGSKANTTAAQKTLVEILRDFERGLTPEQLFLKAGFDTNRVEDFYQELRGYIESSQVKERRPNETDVYLEAVST